LKLALTATPSAAPFAPIIVKGGVERAFALAAELGYDGLELHLRRPTDVDWSVVKALATDHNLKIPMLGTGMAVDDGLSFSDPDPEVRRQAVERIKEHIELAVYLGSAVVLGSVRGSLGSDAAHHSRRRGFIMDCMAECCEASSRVGVGMLLEPINRYETNFINTVDQALEVLEQLGSPCMKLLVDTFHMNIEEADIGGSVRRAGCLVGHVHFGDSNREAPGHGHLDLLEVLRALQEIEYRGYLSFEVLPLPNTRQDSSCRNSDRGSLDCRSTEARCHRPSCALVRSSPWAACRRDP
jgi:sugar phosphate isomerase/epimerase